MSSFTTLPEELIYQSPRQNSDTRLKRQYAANVLQQYPFQALYSLQHHQNPAKTRLDMMRLMTDLPKSVEEQYRKTSGVKPL